MRRLVVPFLAGLALAAPSRAQVALPDSVITTTRIPTAIARVPAAVTVLTRQDIEERGYQTLAEALTAVPGLRLAPSGGLGQQTSAFLRGNGSANTLVLLDGVPVNDVSSPNAAFDFGQDFLLDIERIEVLRGPASTLYGSAAIGGVINLVTRRAPPDRAFAPFGEVAAGSNATIRGGGGVAGTVGIADYLFSGQSISTRGSNAVAPRFESNAGERDGFRGAAGTVRLGLTPREGTRIEGLLRWRENKFGLDSVPLDDPNYTGLDRRWFGQLRGETQVFDGVWTTGLRGFATENRRRFTNLPDSLNDSAEDARFRGTRTGIDWGNTVKLPGFGAFTDGALGFGITHALEEVRNDQNFPSAFGDFTTTTRASQHTTAGFGSLQYRLSNRLDLTAALRHDAVTGFTDETTWRLGAVLALPELASRVRVAGGSAFRAPSLFERFGIGRFDGFTVATGNPDLKPERSLGWEVGADTDYLGRLATTSWTVFGSEVRDQIVNVFSGSASTYVNVNRADILGAELGLTVRPHRTLEATANWTITEATDAATDRRLPRRPEHVVSITARLAPIPKVVIAPTVLITGRSPDVLYANDGSFIGRGTTPAGTIFNLTASWRAIEQITLFLEGRNLGNSRWEPVNGFVTPGRTVLVGTRFAL
jgi:vitamin B12 transporter